MPSDDNLKAICSVTELANTLGLSRTRFYQLQKTDAFPMPVYCVRTRRPFYTLELQQECVVIRKTGIGHNGQPIVFNAPRKSKSGKSNGQINHEYEELARCLKGLGPDVSLDKVKAAVKTLYPQGLPKHPDKGRVIKELYTYLNPDCERSGQFL